MIALFVLLTALAFVSVHAAHDSADGCKAESAIDDATFKSLLSSIGATPFSSNKQKIVEQFVAANLTHGFAGPQTLALLQALDFTSSKTQLIRTIKPWVLGMTCDEMTALLGAQTFSSGKMDTLKDLVDFVIDLPDNNATIISAFTFSSDQKKAQKLIDDATPISCLFGDPNQRKHMVFVIDYSGSMSTTMKDPAGNTVTRLQFVQSQLQFVLEKSLHKSQFLNIIAFSDAASAWSPGVVSATDANVASAVAFANKLRPYRGTNMLAALQLAVSDSAVEGIVLLSDGEPNGGRAQMISLAQSWRTQDRIINTVLLEAGGPAQSGAAAFLCSLANAGGGVCRTNN